MKKFLLMLLAACLLIFAACSNEKASEDNKEDKKAKEEQELKEIRGELLSYQAALNKLIYAVDGKFANLLDSAEKEDYTAKQAVEEFNKAVDELPIPEKLSEQKEDIQKALEDLKAFMNKKAEIIESGGSDFADAQPLREAFVEKMTAVFNSIELAVPDFSSIL